MRDIISHRDNEIDEVEVFTASKNDIPELENIVLVIIKDINDQLKELERNKET